MLGYLKKHKMLQFIIPLLVVSFLLPINLAARVRYSRGVKLVVYKIDGEIIKGQLVKVDVNEGRFTVKPRKALTGTRIKIDDVDKLRVKDVKAGRYIGFGLLIGVGLSYAATSRVDRCDGGCEDVGIFYGTVYGGLAGLVLGAVLGLAKKKSGRKIYVMGRGNAEKKAILEKLASKAMIRN
jgi:hypothetical protein